MEHGRSAADFDDLSRQVRELTALVTEQQTTLAQQQATIAAQHEALARAQEQLTLLKKALFSPRRERYVPSPDQKLLFVAETVGAPPDKIASSTPRSRSKPKHRRRFLIPEFLPEHRIEHALPEHERPCGCCGEERVIIGEHVTRQIELTRATAHVEVHVRYTYACKHCRRGEQVVTTSKACGADRKESIRRERAGLDRVGQVRAAPADVPTPGDAVGAAGNVALAPLTVSVAQRLCAGFEAFGPAVVVGDSAELRGAGR